MEKICRKCERLLEGGDIIRATVITKYVALKSKLHYALEKPTSCVWVEHLQCNDPKGEYEQDENITDQSNPYWVSHINLQRILSVNHSLFRLGM